MQEKALVWFTQDLRINDNPALSVAHYNSKEVLHVFFLKDFMQRAYMPSLEKTGKNRLQFLLQGLLDLKNNLLENGHDLLIINDHSINQVPKLIAEYDINAIYRAELHGYYERKDWQTLKLAFLDINFNEFASYSMYGRNKLPFKLNQLPKNFTKFRKLIEKKEPSFRKRVGNINWADSIKLNQTQEGNIFSQLNNQNFETKFQGGESSATHHLKRYFSSNAASIYKETRNELLNFNKSTKFSPWLAQGSLSVLDVLDSLKEYEKSNGANDSTYWIFFELLWREYFFWNALVYGKDLFIKKGRQDYPPLTTFYPERFNSWVNGTTAWPIVNACMHELSATGFISNRGRQLVASCLINELEIDWRYGAAYFEQQLIDYDVGSNWGNWQYLAGVGADPRGHRRFDLNKQTNMYDPNHEFINYWEGNKKLTPKDSRDVADWPIS